MTLIDAAFKHDPTLGWCFFAHNPGFDERRENYLRSYLTYHHNASLPVLGMWVRGVLVAVSYFTPGSSVEEPAMVSEPGRHIALGCGEQSLSRIDLLREAVESKRQFSDCSRIEFIGVFPMLQGNGIGSVLLEATLSQLGEIDPSRSVLLETGESRNLPFYLRHGFTIQQQIEFPGLRQYLLQKRAAFGDSPYHRNHVYSRFDVQFLLSCRNLTRRSPLHACRARLSPQLPERRFQKPLDPDRQTVGRKTGIACAGTANDRVTLTHKL